MWFLGHSRDGGNPELCCNESLEMDSSLRGNERRGAGMTGGAWK